MLKRILPLLLAAAIVFTLVSCKPADDTQITPLSTSAQSPTPIPTSTSIPTKTPPPSQTQIPTLTPPPPQTAIPFETKEPLFPLPTFYLFDFLTTPIPTPDQLLGNYSLPSLNYEEYITLIKIAEEYTHENDQSVGFGENRTLFIGYQDDLSLLIKEAIYYSSNAEEQEELTWRLARSHAVAGRNDYDEWILSQIESQLNAGLLSPQSINDYLVQYGFNVEKEMPYQNLFGNGETSTVLIINTNYDHYVGNDGIIAVLRGNKPGNYELYKAASKWIFDIGYWERSERLSVADPCPDDTIDINGNGIPEMCFFFQRGISGAFPTNLFLIEWNGEEFINLAENTVSFSDGGIYPGSIEFDTQNPSEPILRIATDFIPQSYYHYELVNNRFKFIEKEYRYLFDELKYLFVNAKYTKAVDLLTQTIDAGPPYKEIDRTNDYENELTDTLRFTLAMAYAYNGEVDQAKNMFLTIANAPTQEYYSIYPDLANKFNKNYYDQFDLIAPCGEIKQTIDAFLNQPNSEAEQKQTLGYIFTYNSPLSYICDSHYAISSAIEILPTDLPVPLPDFLRDVGIQVLKSSIVNMNDIQAWMLYIQSPLSENYTSLLAIPYQGQWHVTHFGGDSIDSLPYENIIYTPLPGLSYPALVIESHRYSEIYKLQIENNQVELLWITYLDSNPIIRSSGSKVVILSSISETQYDLSTYEDSGEEIVWNALIWDPETLVFKDYFPPVFDNPEFVIELAQINPEMNPSYELALAYQITGNLEKAKEIYWRTWAEDPGSMLALIAREKLSGVSP